MKPSTLWLISSLLFISPHVHLSRNEIIGFWLFFIVSGFCNLIIEYIDRKSLKKKERDYVETN